MSRRLAQPKWLEHLAHVWDWAWPRSCERQRVEVSRATERQRVDVLVAASASEWNLRHGRLVRAPLWHGHLAHVRDWVWPGSAVSAVWAVGVGACLQANRSIASEEAPTTARHGAFGSISRSAILPLHPPAAPSPQRQGVPAHRIIATGARRGSRVRAHSAPSATAGGRATSNHAVSAAWARSFTRGYSLPGRTRAASGLACVAGHLRHKSRPKRGASANRARNDATQ